MSAESQGKDEGSMRKYHKRRVEQTTVVEPDLRLESSGCSIPLNVGADKALKMDEMADNAERSPSNLKVCAFSAGPSGRGLKNGWLHNCTAPLLGGAYAWPSRCCDGRTRFSKRFSTGHQVGLS
jgi:hypothetical protein